MQQHLTIWKDVFCRCFDSFQQKIKGLQDYPYLCIKGLVPGPAGVKIQPIIQKNKNTAIQLFFFFSLDF